MRAYTNTSIYHTIVYFKQKKIIQEYYHFSKIIDEKYHSFYDNKEREYFAVYLSDNTERDQISGGKAKEITMEIFKRQRSKK